MDPPDPRRYRSSGGWAGSSYAYPLPPPSDVPLPFLTGPSARLPPDGSGRPERSTAAPAPPSAGPSPAPARSGGAAAPGLYDLPTLLARIWSVPAARLATSGSYPSRPDPSSDRPDFGPSVPSDPRGSERPEPPPTWATPSYELSPSLPLAAVPSLTFAPDHRPGLVGAAVGSPEKELPRGPYVLPTQYIAWRHPPCRLAYLETFPRGSRCPRGVPAEGLGRGGPALSAGPVRWLRKDEMMRPATAGWALHRFDLGAVSTA